MENGIEQRSKTRWLSLLLIVSLVLGACGTESGEEDVSTTDDAPTATADSPDTTVNEAAPTDEPVDPVTITVSFGREDLIPTDNFETFHANNPGITVETEILGFGSAATDYLRAFQAGNEPDIVNVEGHHRVALSAAGTLYDLTEEMERWETEDPEVYNSLYDIAFEDGSVDGVPYGVALTAQVTWYLYNINRLEAAGLEPPETFEDVLEAARVLRDEDFNGHCIVLSAQRGPRAEMYQHFFAMGGEFDNGVPIIDSEAGIYLIDFIQTLRRENLITEDALAWGSGDMRGAFESDRCAFAEGPPHMVSHWDDALGYGEFFGAVPTPYREGHSESRRHHIVTTGWYVSANTEHPYEASLVLRYLANEEILGEIHERYFPSASRAVWNSDWLPETHPWVAQPELRGVMDEGVSIPINPQQLEMEEVLMNLWEEAAGNPDADPSALAAEYQERLDAFR